MQHDTFIGQVQDRAQLGSRGEAERATRALLETLGERVPYGLADNLAGQLPREIAEHLRRTGIDGETGARFDLPGFVARVRARLGGGADDAHAAYLARVVFEVVDEASHGRVTERVRDAVGADIAGLLLAGSAGETPR